MLWSDSYPSVTGKDDSAEKATQQDASKHLGGRKGKQQTMKTNTTQAAAFSTWTRFATCNLRHFQAQVHAAVLAHTLTNVWI